MIDLGDTTVLVTGGSRGIGAAIARQVGSLGATVILHYGQSEAAARRVQDAIGSEKCHLVQADLSDPQSVAKVWSGARDKAERIDVLVNNAGIFEPAPSDAAAAGRAFRRPGSVVRLPLTLDYGRLSTRSRPDLGGRWPGSACDALSASTSMR